MSNTYVQRERRVYADDVVDTRDGVIPARIVLQPIAAPSILGLFGFAAATMMVAAWLAGWYGSPTSPTFLFPFAAVFGGLAQFLAGMWAYKARDPVATAMHGAWGSFWLAYGLLFGLVAAKIIHVPALGAAQPELGFWFIMLAAVTGSGAIASLAESGGLFAVLAPLAAGSGILGVAMWVGSLTWVHVAGWVLVFSAGIAWYVATAMMFEGAFGRIVLPLFKYRRIYNVPGERPTRPIEYEHGQPGVKQGQ